MSRTKIIAEINRRNLLKYLGNAAICAPFMRTLLETEAFGADRAKRALFFFYPDGIVPDKFHPSTLGANFDLKMTTKPFESVRGDIVMIRGSKYSTMEFGSHEAGASFCLTGTINQGPAISLDSYLGTKLKAGVSLPVLRLGVGATFQTNVDKAISFAAPGVPATLEDNPKKAFANIFGGTPTSPDNSGTPKTLGAKGQKSVLDSGLSDLKALQNRLGSIEKSKLDLHVESVRELERRTQIMIDQENGGGGTDMGSSCNRMVDFRGFNIPDKEPVDPPIVLRNENFNTVCDIQIDIAVQAMACGITNVVLFQMSHAVSPLTMDFLGGPNISKFHHDISHFGENSDEHAKNQAYFMSKYAKIISTMKSVKEGDKSLLYNSITMCVSDLAHSNFHDFKNVGVVLAGQAGGYLKTGRAIDVAGANHGQTLVSTLQALGIQEDTFGQASGALPGLV
ncbi:MAG: DUF1552 domain-containing protein [Proteobacteria bacterium]|nr:MAG: DUF1552 domain-containing protein [Pseudomonadota bacterium]